MSQARHVVVDLDRCESNAVCVDNAPDVFSLDDRDGLLTVDNAAVTDQNLDDVILAVKRCPRAALRLVET